MCVCEERTEGGEKESKEWTEGERGREGEEREREGETEGERESINRV